MLDHNALNAINEELKAAITEVQECTISAKQLQKAEDSLTSLRKQYGKLTEQLKREQKDVDKLQSLSFSNFFHSLINDKSERLSKEEQEVLAVKTQVDGLQYEIQETEKSVRALTVKSNGYEAAQLKYQELLEKKKSWIETHLPDKWEEILRLTRAQDEGGLQGKEITEAMMAGTKVMNSIKGIMDSLNSAAGWGTYDMLGGGMIASIAKRNRMDEAQEQINKLKYLLSTFNQELSDVGAFVNADLHMDNFLGFADWFFDSFLVDMAVQSKINDARNQISSLKSKVEEIQTRLSNEYKYLENEIRELDDKIEALIQAV